MGGLSFMSSYKCESCAWRKKAEADPRKFSSRLWYWHTKFCPGWKAYQKSLNHNDRGPEFAGR